MRRALFLLWLWGSSHCAVWQKSGVLVKKGHQRDLPWTWNHNSTCSIVSIKPLLLQTKIKHPESVFSALLTSGSRGNFMNHTIAKQLRLLLIELHCPVKLNSIDGGLVGMGLITQCTKPLCLQVSSLDQDCGLPLHRLYDCGIDLLPCTTPCCHAYTLSHTEHKAMEEYVHEALKQQYIVP